MTKSQLSKSTRIFIRREKARIRREFWGLEEQKEKIKKLYERFGMIIGVSGNEDKESAIMEKPKDKK